MSHALPLRLRRQVVGALNLFTIEPRALTDEHLAVAQGMADVATIGLLHERALRDQVVLAEQLQAALHSRIVIEQAKEHSRHGPASAWARRSAACGSTPHAPANR